MQEKHFKNSIGSAIILSLLIAPIFYARQAQAQVSYGQGLSGSNSINTGATTSGSASAAISGVLPAIMALPGCKSAVKNLFSSSTQLNAQGQEVYTGDTGSTGSADATDVASATQSFNHGEFTSMSGDSAEAATDLTKEVDSATAQIEAIRTYNTATDKKISETASNSKQILEKENAMEVNQNCLNGIGKIIAKKLLQEITLSTVRWIQSGYDGKPFFVQDTKKFFADIGKHEILTFSAEISDPTKYPYGKAFLQNMATSYNQKFQDNARYSLNEMIAKTNPQYSAVTFQADFAQGGWDAWDAMIQVPANNPLGFQMIASSELGKRLAGTSQSDAQNMRDSLQQANGFLGDQKCVDSYGRLNGITREEDNWATKLDELYKENSPTMLDSATDEPLVQKYGLSPRHCEKWEYVTPGKTIADMMTKSIGNSDKSLIDVNTFNDAIAAILDAAVAQFSGQLTQKGLAYMSTNGQDYHYNSSNGFSTQSGASSDFTQAQLNDSSWLSQNSRFNIRTDVNQALIDTQRTYMDKLVAENLTLNELVKNIRQLDYCIPGPNPDWANTSQNAMQSVLDGKNVDMGSSTIIDVNNAINGTGLGQAGQSAAQSGVSYLLQGVSSFLSDIPIVPIVGAIVGAFASYDEQEKIKQAMARYITSILKVWIDDWRGHGNQSEIQDIATAKAFIENVFNNYRTLVNKTFFVSSDEYDKFMPNITPEARSEFRKISGYQQIIINNGETVNSVKGIITKLQNIKDDIDKLNLKLASGSINQDDYNNALIPIKNSFARISMSIYTGDDIASADSLSKQAKDENKYVHDTLLMGKYGCEKSMETLWKTDKVRYGKYAGRQPYPFPIDHLYQPAIRSILSNTNPYDPSNYKPWNAQSVADLSNSIVPGTYDGREGFMFGAIYSNPFSRYDTLCDPYYFAVLETQKLNGFFKGSELGTNLSFGANECGSVTRGLEKSFSVY